MTTPSRENGGKSKPNSRQCVSKVKRVSHKRKGLSLVEATATDRTRRIEIQLNRISEYYQRDRDSEGGGDKLSGKSVDKSRGPMHISLLLVVLAARTILSLLLKKRTEAGQSNYSSLELEYLSSTYYLRCGSVQCVPEALRLLY